MEPLVMLLLAALAGVLAFFLARRIGTGGLFTDGAGRLPRQFAVANIREDDIPTDARAPLDYLAKKLEGLGFVRAEGPVRVPALGGLRHQLLLAPFFHAGESTVFLMGIDARWPPRSELMLHILTPLNGDRRVETSTLSALANVRPPEKVDLRIVEDADSVEEIWSRHRQALTRFERAERVPIQAAAWRDLVSAAYGSWVEAAIRAQRLRLSSDGTSYELRLRY